MKKLLYCVVVLLFLVYSGFTAQDNKSGANNAPKNLNLGPETIDMSKIFNVKNLTQKPVIFPHRFLQESLEYKCDLCHMSKQGGGPLKDQNTGKELKVAEVKGAGNVLHTNFCWPCHTRMNVPQGRVCNKCHK
jgi:hypothetical protein